jgi:hypothetical protein
MIIAQPGISQIEAKEIASRCGLDRTIVDEALQGLGKLGRFYSGASISDEHGYVLIQLMDESVYDEYLRYKGLENLLERFYIQNKPNETGTASYWDNWLAPTDIASIGSSIYR